jgi:DNA helicase-2/ATP-dependent DNA helicase PcrA
MLHEAVNAELEARYVAEKIRGLMSRGTRAKDIAILFRTNFQSRALEEALLRAGVPYRVLGTRFFERKEVKDILAWMRLALEPSREVDQMRAAQAPARGIGKTTLAKLAAGKRSELRASEYAKLEAFEEVVRALNLAAETSLPSAFVRLTIEKSGMQKALEEGSDEERERFANIQELATLASRHDALVGREGIAAFLAEAALASDQDTLDHPTLGKEEEHGVSLMTAHAAKGLEFCIVFVTGMEEGLFPHEHIGGEEERDEEEERRLFYVAMTRAKERLILTFARVRKIYGTDFLQEPSTFLGDIDPALLMFEEECREPIIEA